MVDSALVLFDIDGTLLRKSGPHHRQALVDAARRVTGRETTTENVPVAGMLDRDILTQMLRNAGATKAEINRAMPDLVRHAQTIYSRTCPNLKSKVCPGVRGLLLKLRRAGIPAGLVTGNLSKIAWKKMEHAGLHDYFRYGAFAEAGRTRAALLKLAIQQARREGWIRRGSPIAFVGDHPNDIGAARANKVRSVAVCTGVVGPDELQQHSPDVLVPDMRTLTLEMLFA